MHRLRSVGVSGLACCSVTLKSLSLISPCLELRSLPPLGPADAAEAARKLKFEFSDVLSFCTALADGMHGQSSASPALLTWPDLRLFLYGDSVGAPICRSIIYTIFTYSSYISRQVAVRLAVFIIHCQ